MLSPLVGNVNAPPTRLPLNNVVAPSMNATVPVGVGSLGCEPLAVAVNVTVCPNGALLADAVSWVVDVRLTVWASGLDWLPAKLALPA